MFKIRVILLLGLLACGTAWAQDEFDAVMCGSNMPKVLMGKHYSNGRVVVIEGRHKNLGKV